MASMYNQILLGYRDTSGRECTSFWSAIDQDSGAAAAYAALAEKVQACSDCAVTAVQFQQTLLLGNEPAEGPYNTILDRVAVLAKITATGKPFTFDMVGPKETIILPDRITLDLGNADVLALETAMIGAVGDLGGNAMGPFRRGYRTEAKGGR